MMEEEFSDDLSKEELDLFAEFTESLVRGERPVIEDFLARLRTGSKENLRESLEAAVWFRGLVEEFKRECPGKTIWDVLGIRQSWERWWRIHGKPQWLLDREASGQAPAKGNYRGEGL
jgi:hypothetical protein